MSDMYLVLRSRLDAVANWQSLGSEVMKTARKQRGLSYEAVGRIANVSSKTYERYERDGRVPEHMVNTFAEILGLEIERAEPARPKVRISVSSSDKMDGDPQWLRPLREELEVEVARLRRLNDALEVELAPAPPGRTRRGQ